MIEEYIAHPRGFDEIFELVWAEEDGGSYVLRSKERIRKDVIRVFDNFMAWMGDRQPVFVEYPLSSQRGFHGRIDLIADDVLVDFKTGKKTNGKESKLQLAAYYLLCEENDVPVERGAIVFLGGDTYSVSEIQNLAEYKDEFLRMVFWAMAVREEAIITGKMVDARPSIRCVYCPYTYHCRGI